MSEAEGRERQKGQAGGRLDRCQQGGGETIRQTQAKPKRQGKKFI